MQPHKNEGNHENPPLPPASRTPPAAPAEPAGISQRRVGLVGFLQGLFLRKLELNFWGVSLAGFFFEDNELTLRGLEHRILNPEPLHPGSPGSAP